MRTHNYLARIDDEIWLDLNRVKQLDGRSINSLLMEGARKIRDQKLMVLFVNIFYKPSFNVILVK